MDVVGESVVSWWSNVDGFVDRYGAKLRLIRKSKDANGKVCSLLLEVSWICFAALPVSCAIQLSFGLLVKSVMEDTL